MSMRRINLVDLDPSDYLDLTRRSAVPDASVRKAAADIVDQVRMGGDAALLAANGRYGGGPAIGSVRVPSEMIGAAFSAVGPAVRQALKEATKNIRKVHDRQWMTVSKLRRVLWWSADGPRSIASGCTCRVDVPHTRLRC